MNTTTHANPTDLAVSDTELCAAPGRDRESHSDKCQCSDAVAERLDNFVSRLLKDSPHSATVPELKRLVCASHPGSDAAAKVRMSSGCRFLVDQPFVEGRPLSEILTADRIVLWVAAKTTEEMPLPTISNHRGRLNTLRDVIVGIPRPVKGSVEVVESPAPLSSIDVDKVFVAVRGDREATAGAIAGLGAGVVGAHLSGARLVADDTHVSVFWGERSTRIVDSLQEQARFLVGAELGPTSWPRLIGHLDGHGITLSASLVRQTWRHLMVSSGRPVGSLMVDYGLTRLGAEHIIGHLPAVTLGDLIVLRCGVTAPLRIEHTLGAGPRKGAVTTEAPVPNRKSTPAQRIRMMKELAAERAQLNVLTDEQSEFLSRYLPSGIDPADWAPLADDHRRAMMLARISEFERFRVRCSTVAQFLVWRNLHGKPTEPQAAFTFDAIDEYFLNGIDAANDKTRQEYRSRLKMIAETINPANRALRSPSTGAIKVRPGYSDAEVAAIVRVTRAQRSQHARRTLSLAVGLGLGAGLDSVDLNTMCRKDIDDQGDNGIWVTVTGSRARLVPVRVEFESLVRRGLEGLRPNQPLFGQKLSRTSVIGRVVEKSDVSDCPHIEGGRLRSTWLCWVLSQPIPLRVVIEAAGLKTARTLSDLAEYLPAMPVDDRLRGVAS